MKNLFKYIIICALLLLLDRSNAQNRKIDSLLVNIKTGIDDSNKVNSLNLLCLEYISEDLNDSALRFSLMAITIAQKINFKKGLSSAHNILGNIYYFQANYPQSLENNLAALKIRETIGNRSKIADSYNNIGNVYLNMNNTEEALKNHFAALKIRKQINDTLGIGFSYNNIGNVFQKQKKYPMALEYQLSALKIRQSQNDLDDISTTMNNIGIIYTEMGDYKNALEYQFNALKIKQEINDKEGIEITYVNLAITYLKLKEYKIAEDYAIKAIALASEIGDVETIIEANLQLSEIYKKTNNFEKSLYHYTTYISLRDSLFTQSNIEKTVQAQLQYEFDKTAAATKLEQEKKEAVANAENKKQQIILILISCVLFLVLAFAIITYRNYLQKQKANTIIIKQKHEVEEQKSTIEEKNKDITGSITYAKRIQEAILPSIESIKKEFPDSFIIYKPKDIIGGDFYWVSDAVTKYDEKFSMLAVADCTGHGVPGALMSIIGNNYLRLCEREPSVNRPSEALDFINSGISRTLRQEYSKSTIQDGMDMVFVAIDYHNSVLHFAGAKNPIYIIREGNLTEYKGDRHPIGAFVGEMMQKFTNHTIPIQKGDCIYLFSDGYADQSGGPKGKKFMYQRFKDLLVSNCNLPMEKQGSLLLQAFEEWKGNNDQVDDVCVFGIRI